MCCLALLLPACCSAEEFESKMFVLEITEGHAGSSFSDIANSSDFYLRCEATNKDERVNSIICETLHSYVIHPDNVIASNNADNSTVFRVHFLEHLAYDIVMFTALDADGNYLDSCQLLCIRQSDGSIIWKYLT